MLLFVAIVLVCLLRVAGQFHSSFHFPSPGRKAHVTSVPGLCASHLGWAFSWIHAFLFSSVYGKVISILQGSVVFSVVCCVYTLLVISGCVVCVPVRCMCVLSYGTRYL